MSDGRSNLRKFRHVEREWFRDIYEVQQLPVSEIAEKIGGKVHNVKRLAHYFGLTIRNGLAGRIVESRRASIDIKEATRLYLEEKWPCDRIAEIFSCFPTTINRRLKKAGVKLRHHNDTKRGAKARNRIEIEAAPIVAAYRKKWGSASEIAKQYGVSNRVIIRVLKEAGVPRKSFSDLRDFTGNKSPRWRYDLSPREREQRRDTNAQADWRIEVFERDDYTCKGCGDASGGNLNAHHIEPHYRNKPLRWEISNGITLCSSCHRTYHKVYGIKRCNAVTLSEFLAPRMQAA